MIRGGGFVQPLADLQLLQVSDKEFQPSTRVNLNLSFSRQVFDMFWEFIFMQTEKRRRKKEKWKRKKKAQIC